MNKTLESLAPQGATHYELPSGEACGRKAGYMRLNQEGTWDFWAHTRKKWISDNEANNLNISGFDVERLLKLDFDKVPQKPHYKAGNVFKGDEDTYPTGEIHLMSHTFKDGSGIRNWFSKIVVHAETEEETIKLQNQVVELLNNV